MRVKKWGSRFWHTLYIQQKHYAKSRAHIKRRKLEWTAGALGPYRHTARTKKNL